jgi:DNA-binding transcriptional MerR regulator
VISRSSGRCRCRTLHHYDERGLLKPARIDDWTGYRFYSVEQLPRLNRILALKDLGFSLEQIGRLVDDDVPAEQLRGMLALKQAEIERQLTAGRTRLLRVEARLRQIEQEGEPSPYEIVLKKTSPQTIASTRTTVPTLEDMPALRCDLYDELYEALERRRVEPGTPEFALYHTVEYLERDIDMEAAVAVDGPRGAGPEGGGDRPAFRELPAVREMASVVHEGAPGRSRRRSPRSSVGSGRTATPRRAPTASCTSTGARTTCSAPTRPTSTPSSSRSRSPSGRYRPPVRPLSAFGHRPPGRCDRPVRA